MVKRVVRRIYSEALEQGILARRAATYEWIWTNYETLVTVIDAAVRPPWAAIAALADEAGVRDRSGNKPSRQTMFSTWQRVIRDKAQRAIPAVRQASPSTEPLPHIEHNRTSAISYGPRPKGRKDLWE